jgi:translation initiation factor IF-1
MDKKSTEKASSPETLTGTVVEALPNTMFRVQVEDGDTHLVYLSGKMRRFRIRVLIGDTVKFEVDPYGGKGRITQRM